MNSKTPPPAPQDPFSTYKSHNPFVSAMPALADPQDAPTALPETWGHYARIETLDDDEGAAFGEELALEVLITWGSSVLHVAHLSPPRTFTIGDESDGSGEAVDFHLPESVLGRKRLTLVGLEGDQPFVVMPEFAEGMLQIGAEKKDLRALMASAPACPTATRATQHSLARDHRMTMKIGDFEFFVRLVNKSAPIEKGLLANLDWAVPSTFGMTAATMGGLMAALAYFVPPLGLEDENNIDKDRIMLISQYLDAASERERELEPEPAPEAGAEESGESAAKAQGPAGKAGKDEGPPEPKRVAVKGPRDNPQMQLSRQEAISLASDFGMIGLLNSNIAADPNAPTSVFGRDVTLGADDMSANGNLWANSIGESIGSGGLSLYGPGPGGGFGDGLGIGITNAGNSLIGPGTGKEGWGRSNALSTGNHVAKSPRVGHQGETILSGRIPPHVVQRIVRQNFGRFRMCYQQGLGRNPGLEGRIPVRFVIGRDGAVSNVAATGGFPDAQVQSCVQSAFYGLSFPPPDGGIVTVTYPLIFSPS